MDQQDILRWFKKDPSLSLPKISIPLPKILIKNTTCSCRQAKGLTEGWCGVAGAGVPACEH